MKQQEWPFIIIRNYGTGLENKNFIRCTFEAQRRYPGLIEEIWFSGNALAAWEVNQKLALENLIFRDECKKLGICFSYQQGLTLNHAPDGNKRQDIFSEDAWAVSDTGERCFGLFCANSEEAREYTRKQAENFLALLQVDSYWPDDDLRLYSKPSGNICFCDRCLGKFNQKHGYHFTREQLVEQLFGENPSAQVRYEWTLFNGESLGGFASSFRHAVDHVLPSCRLGIQTVDSNWQYDGPDYKPIIENLAGPEHQMVGVRPGACYYSDASPRDMLFKVLAVGEEAARCKNYGFVGQLCYEAENWPHISALKTPEAQMTEAALALASGMDSLALYWGSDKNAESDENYAFYYDTLAQYKPYFTMIRDAFQHSHLTGGSLYHGGNRMGEPEWLATDDSIEIFLQYNALPIVRKSSKSEFYILNHRAVRELAEEDLTPVFSRTVLMDVAAFRLLKTRFPLLKFPEKVRFTDIDGNAHAAGGEDIYECFESRYQALNFHTMIHAESPDVKAFSSFSHNADAMGICTISTEFGGNVVLIQSLDGQLWTGYRRKSILDALDSVIPGGMAARLITNGFKINILTRQDDRNGKTTGVFLLNLSIGGTPDLELAIRNPAFTEYQIIIPKQDPVKLIPVSETATEKRFRIPGLNAWQSVLIAGVDTPEGE